MLKSNFLSLVFLPHPFEKDREPFEVDREVMDNYYKSNNKKARLGDIFHIDTEKYSKYYIVTKILSDDSVEYEIMDEEIFNTENKDEEEPP